MKVVITSKNFNASDNLKETIEKKLGKLDKYFSNDITAHVMILTEGKGSKYKIESTINTKGTIFRSEVASQDPYEALDKTVDRLSSQMSKFKTKLQKKHKDNKSLNFEDLPEIEEEIAEDTPVVKKKRFELTPMTVDEAVMQMELLQHSFFVFLNLETDSVCVVYKRNDKDYGMLETVY